MTINGKTDTSKKVFTLNLSSLLIFILVFRETNKRFGTQSQESIETLYIITLKNMFNFFYFCL